MESTPPRILIVEDNELDRELVTRELKKTGAASTIAHAEDRESFYREFEEFKPELILCDFSLPGFNAFEVLDTVSKRKPETPVIIVTGTLTDETAVECLKRGALDYVLKDKILRLIPAIDRAMELKNSRRERIEFAARLRQSEEQLRTITDVLPALLGYVTTDFRLTFSNKTYEKWFIPGPGKEKQGCIVEIFGSAIADRMRASLAPLERGEDVSFESMLTTSEPPRFVSVSLTPDIEPTGTYKGFVALIMDLSERKRYEDELEAAKISADAANAAKSQFLANMSHEMRTPLSAMLGFAELILSPGQPAAEKPRWAEKIVKNCQRLRVMIDEILDLSKVEAGKLQIDKGVFKLTDLVAQIQSMLSALASEKNIGLRFELKGAVPSEIDSDQVKLRHILVNIIGNAIKFSQLGEVRVVISMMNSDSLRPQLSFCVIDTGRGMTGEQVSHLFEPFTQVDNSMTRKIGGTGLGLTLARKFARALGGDVDLVKSDPSHGSTFEITIDPGDVSKSEPLASLETMFTPTPAPVASEKKIDLRGVKILVVEDSPENQFLMKRFLEFAGASIDVASNGEEGVEKALHNVYDLVLMDIQMPILDGYHATTRLRETGYDKPIVALTAHALKEEREKCMNLGFTGFLTKPIRKEDLLKEVDSFRG
ncbi:MAG: response regulator [Bdellovibrionota bacterium]